MFQSIFRFWCGRAEPLFCGAIGPDLSEISDNKIDSSAVKCWPSCYRHVLSSVQWYRHTITLQSSWSVPTTVLQRWWLEIEKTVSCQGTGTSVSLPNFHFFHVSQFWKTTASKEELTSFGEHGNEGIHALCYGTHHVDIFFGEINEKHRIPKNGLPPVPLLRL